MDSRTAAHALAQIAAYLELRGENRFKAGAYESASRAVLALGADDLRPLHAAGELEHVRGLGPATLAVIRDLLETGVSRYLEELREATPEGLLELLRVPGLSPAKIHKLHEALDIQDLAGLEAAAQDGRLARLPGFGPKTAAKIVQGIAFAREASALMLFPRARVEGARLLAMVREHPDVSDAALAGSLRRGREVVRDVDVVAACRDGVDPAKVATSFTRIGGVRSASGAGAAVAIDFVDGSRLDLRCTSRAAFPIALWRATGSAEHTALVVARLAERGLVFAGDILRDARGRARRIADEDALYRAADLPPIPPELREALGEVDAAARGTLPALLQPGDLRGVLHCHTHYSDGKGSVAEMARAARDRGWDYIGISDHSAAAFYANGLSREKVLAQHEEIDALNAELVPTGFRILKGIEADILADGRLDYDEETLTRFDYVVGSIHSRFSMDGPAMTTRVLRALDEPRLTILAHPTGRLLLAREPYAIDLDAVIEKAAAVGVALELNADPRRLDLDWRHVLAAKRAGATIAIGPDAHSTASLDNVVVGVAMARKGWLGAGDVLNTRPADGVLAFARARHSGSSRRA